MRVAVNTQQSAFNEWPFVMSLAVLPRNERNPETPATAGRALHGNSSAPKLKPWELPAQARRPPTRGFVQQSCHATEHFERYSVGAGGRLLTGGQGRQYHPCLRDDGNR